METIKEIKKKMKEQGVEFDVPWLQLGIKQEGGGVKPTGPHRVKFIEEPKVVKGRDPITQQERQELQFIVEEDGQKKKWSFALYNKSGEPHYLLSRLEDVEVGDEVVLEMERKGVKNYISVKYEGNQEDSGGLPSEEQIEDVFSAEQE